MSLPFHLGLRNNQHIVSLIKEGTGRDVLGVSYPESAEKRSRILAQWGIEAHSPRHKALNTIDIPLGARAQTILSYQLDSAVQSRLAGGITPLVQSRKSTETGVKERLHLGEGRTKGSPSRGKT